MPNNVCPLPLRVGFLTTVDAPLLPSLIASALTNNIESIVAICDAKTISDKDKTLWQERTGGEFERVDLYAFAKDKIPFYFVESHNGQDTLELIKFLGIDCLFNAGTPRRLSKAIISSVKHGIVNIHPGILPEYRGCSAVEWAIFNDDKIGNTAHFMDEGYDTGPIITSEWYEFPKDADYQSIRVRVYRDGCVLAGKVLNAIQESRMTPEDALHQDLTKGQYWEPIPEEKMEKALRKISSQSYLYQCL